MISAETVFNDALLLKSKEKAILVDKLLYILDNSDEQLDKLWAKESEERIRAYEAGELKEIPLNEVLAKYNRSEDES